jgi:hypothetical protein
MPININIPKHSDFMPSAPTPANIEDVDDFVAKVQATKSLDELLAFLETASDTEEDFDVVQAINETRLASGFRVPDAGYGE